MDILIKKYINEGVAASYDDSYRCYQDILKYIDKEGIKRLIKVSNLYAKLLHEKIEFVTMKIQLIEVINAILKRMTIN